MKHICKSGQRSGIAMEKRRLLIRIAGRMVFKTSPRIALQSYFPVCVLQNDQSLRRTVSPEEGRSQSNSREALLATSHSQALA